MSARWVAGSVRARALPNRRLGVAGARALAASPSLDEAVQVLARSPYGRFVRAGDGLAAAQHAVADTLLWHLRVLAGWVPADGVRALRLLAGWFETANVGEQARGFGLPAGPVEPPFRLGRLATAWPWLATAGSLSELRIALARSPWGDPGADNPGGMSLSLRLAWADRVATGVAPARPWAGGAVALLVARQIAGSATGAARRLPEPASATVTRLLGPGWSRVGSVEELARALPPAAAWALRGVRGPSDLWRAEAKWWARLRLDGAALLAGPGFGPRPAIGAAALLAVDAWQVRAALEIAARGAARSEEVLDALA